MKQGINLAGVFITFWNNTRFVVTCVQLAVCFYDVRHLQQFQIGVNDRLMLCREFKPTEDILSVQTKPVKAKKLILNSHLQTNLLSYCSKNDFNLNWF